MSVRNDVLKYTSFLNESDELYCYVNEGVKSDKLNNDIKKQSKSKIAEYVVIPKSDNAVDFAIAVRAASIARSKENKKIYLISKDKHFDLICNEIKKISDTNKIERLDSIDIAILKKMIHENSLENIEAFLNIKFHNYGTPLLNNVKEIIEKNRVSQEIDEIKDDKKEVMHPFRMPFLFTKNKWRDRN